jgi:two-component system chemotaxis response regulator CheY
MSGSIRFLLLNDFSHYQEKIIGILGQAQLNPVWYQPIDKADLLDYLAVKKPAVIFLAVGISESEPVFHFEQVQNWLAAQQLSIPIWMIVEAKDETTAVNAMYVGLADYFFADRLTRLGPAAVKLVGLGKMMLEPVDLNEIMAGVCRECLPLFEAKRQELTFLPAVDLPLVFGKPDLLAQALLSTLEKVIEAAPNGTKETIRPYLDAVKEEVCLEIKLSGENLQTEQQIEETTITESTFTTPREIVELQDGRIHVDSGEGFGIRIRITFPAILEKEVEGSPNLLVVENSPLMRAILKEALEQEGFTIRTAEHGAAALDEMADFLPALIISDIMMPTMDGFAFFEAVREKPEWQDIPFIFVTGQSDQKEHLNTQVLRGATYLIKPIIVEELLVAVHSRLHS